MASIEDQIATIRPHMSEEGLHDFIYGNLFLEISEYGDDRKVEHMSRAYAWQKELGKVITKPEATEKPKETKASASK